MSGGVARETSMTHGWQAVPLVAAVTLVVWGDASLFGVLPVLWWCLLIARTRRTGLTVGMIMVAVLAWFVAPRALWLSGPWVPSKLELLWLYPLLTGVVGVVGVLVERQEPARMLRLLSVPAFGVAGFAFMVIGSDSEKPGWEGVLPGPSEVRVVEGDGGCGSGNCWRELDATGDQAHAVMRAHLESRGYTAASPLAGNERSCRRTGVVASHQVCAELRDTAPNSVRVTWYVN